MKALARVQGATAVVAVARTVFIVAREKGTDRRLLVPAKDNLGGISTGLAFRIESRTTSAGMQASAVVWDHGPVTITADEALAAASGSSNQQLALTDAKDFWL